MITVGMHQAKTQFSHLVERALAGDEIVVTRRGEAVVRLEPVRAVKKSFADLRGTIPELRIAEDFDELPEDVARSLGMVD